MTTLLTFLFVLGVLVFVHELGHFLVARWYGVRVLTFSLGFGPKLLKFTRGDTEYCVSAIPLGGYVKLAGETVEDQNRTGQPDEFLSKSKWVRFQVYLAGPVMNLVLAVIVLAGVLSQGADVPLYLSSPPVVGEITEDSPAEAVGLEVGDRIVSVDGTATPTWEELDLLVVPRAGQELTLVADRGGQPIELRVTPDAMSRYELGDLGVMPVQRPQIVDVMVGPAERAGFEPGDVLLALDGEEGLGQQDVIDRIQAHANQPLDVLVERDGRELTLTVTPEGPEGAGLIGVQLSGYETRRVNLTGLEAIEMSLVQNWENTLLIGRTLRGLVTRETPVRQLMGPVAIADMSGTAAERGWLSVFSLMAMISLNLGLLNLLPIPVLDGGHITILAVEGLARRDLSVQLKERILMAGVAVIMLLMVTVIYNDIARLLR